MAFHPRLRLQRYRMMIMGCCYLNRRVNQLQTPMLCPSHRVHRPQAAQMNASPEQVATVQIRPWGANPQTVHLLV